MAVGDAKNDLVELNPGEVLHIRPPPGEEWVIHNIVVDGAVELYFTNGEKWILVDTNTGPGGWLGFFFHVTYNYWYAVKNVDTRAVLVGYDGIQTK